MSTWTDFVTEAFERGHGQAIGYLAAQRWFGSKGRRLTGIRVIDQAARHGTPDAPVLTILGVEFADGPPERYFLPLVVRCEQTFTASHEANPIATAQIQGQSASVREITIDPSACLGLLDSIRQGDRWLGMTGVFTCTHTPAFATFAEGSFANVKAIGAEQSNTSLVYDSRAILKLIRKLEAGVNPDGEILEFLTKTSYRHVPALLGQIRYDGGNGTESASSATVAILTTFIPNEGDGWAMALRHLDGLLADNRWREDSLARSDAAAHVTTYSGEFLSRMRRLGEITAGLHVALASDASDPAFRPEPIAQADIAKWQAALREEIQVVMRQVRAMPARVLDPLALSGDALAALEAACMEKTADASLLTAHGVMKIRIHGDYHLGQVLNTKPDFIILDFEGEPARTLHERRAKACPLKDVAGMLRSFNYARHVALRQSKSSSATHRMLLELWEQETADAFLVGYHAIAKPGDVAFLPDSLATTSRLLALFQLEKAVYELRYEINNRPDWVEIPIQGLRRLLEQ